MINVRFVINQKSVSTGHNEGFDENLWFHWTEKLLPFKSVYEKLKKKVSSSRNKIFLKHLIAVMISNKYEWNYIVSNNQKPAIGHNKGFI